MGAAEDEVPVVGTELYDADFDAFVKVNTAVPNRALISPSLWAPGVPFGCAPPCARGRAHRCALAMRGGRRRGTTRRDASRHQRRVTSTQLPDPPARTTFCLVPAFDAHVFSRFGATTSSRRGSSLGALGGGVDSGSCTSSAGVSCSSTFASSRLPLGSC